MGGKIFKELIIFVLLVLVVLFTLSMVFYDFFHNTQELPKIKEYIADSNVKATLQEIDANNEEKDESESLLKSYEIVNADLKIYQSDGSYDKGNANPFGGYQTRASMEYEAGIGKQEENDDGNTTTTKTSSTTSSTKTSTTTTNTTSTKSSSSTTTTTTNTSSTQGTLFEEPNSK